MPDKSWLEKAGKQTSFQENKPNKQVARGYLLGVINFQEKAIEEFNKQKGSRVSNMIPIEEIITILTNLKSE